MSHHIETELKVLLSKDHFHKLFKHFDLTLEPTIVQRNTYYDTPDRKLKSVDAALRLRNFVHASEWTIKHRQDDYRSLEFNQINSEPVNPIPTVLTPSYLQSKEILSFLKDRDIPLSCLQQTHDIKTERWNVQTDFGEFALDKSYYLNITDYEIELETEQLELAEKAFTELLSQLNIPYQPADTKISRVAQYAAKSRIKSPQAE